MAQMIDAETRHTLVDLLNRGELDGYERVTAMPYCPICGGPMRRWEYVRPAGFLHGEDVKIVHECRAAWCGQTEIKG